MSEVFETFATYLTRLEKAQPELVDKPIILSRETKIAFLKDGDDESITKVPIAWPLYQYNMFYVVNVPPKKHVAKHSHDEDIFRFVVKGSMLINDIVKVSEGEWFVIRSGTPYEIQTETGYTTIAAYTSVCRTNRGAEGLHLEVDG